MYMYMYINMSGLHIQSEEVGQDRMIHVKMQLTVEKMVDLLSSSSSLP